MSDRNYPMSKYVKWCRQCLVIMSLCVMICQTVLSIVVAEDVDHGLGGSDINFEIADGGPLLGHEQETTTENMSDTEGAIITEPDDNGGLSKELSQGETVSGESTMVSDTEGETILGSGQSESELGSGDDDMSIIDIDTLSPSNSGSIATGTIDISLKTPSNSEEINSQDQEQPLMLMTSFALVDPSPQISITEVRIDGTDEYIELTNRGDPFVGSISISGVKTSGLLTVSLDLGTNDSVVIGDNLDMVIQSGFDIITGQGLSMTDMSARSLQLIYDDVVIDYLDLTATQVIGSDNLKASREYDASTSLWQIIPSNHDRNIVSGEHGNPGVVRGLTAFDIVDEGTETIVTGDILTGDILTGDILTGDILTGDILTGDILTGDILTGDITTGGSIPLVQISQVYPFADCVGEHVALSFSAPYSGPISIAGLGTSDSIKTFDIVVAQPGTRYIVESMSGVLSDNVILVPGMTLTDGGESLVMTNAGGEVLDSIIYSSTQTSKASSFTSNSGAVRLFTSNQAPSIVTSCAQSQQTAQIGGCRINASDPVYLSGVFTTSFAVSGDSLGSPTCEGGQRSVDGVVSTSDSCSLGQSFVAGSHRVVYQQYSGTDLICEDEYMIMGAIQAQSLAQNPVVSSCSSSSSSSYYEILYRKRKEKRESLADNIRELGYTVRANDTIGNIDKANISMSIKEKELETPNGLMHIVSGGLITVENIIADGLGNDRDGTEQITLYNPQDVIQDISDWQLIINNRYFYPLQGVISGNSYQLVQSYFPLPNNGGCVVLVDSNNIIQDHVCYGGYSEDDVIVNIVGENKSTLSPLELSPEFIKSCLKIEEYALLELDIREQKLINTAQKKYYQGKVDDVRQILRERTDELYTTYRSITDSKQAYIDRQQSYIDSQQAYIEKLKGQLNRSSEYATRITELYNGNKEYIQTLHERNNEAWSQQQYIQRNYPAIYQDPNLQGSGVIDTSVVTTIPTTTTSTPSRRSTLKTTITNLF